MLIQPLLTKLTTLKLSGFRDALEEQLRNPQYADLPFEERLGLLVDIELIRRTNSRLARRIRSARFPLLATIEDLDLSPRRGLQRAYVLQMAKAEWIRQHLNCIILGPTGAGKTFLASALGRASCQAELAVRYFRTSRLLHALQLARADGSYPQLLRSLAKTPLLILDDWLRDPLTTAQARDILEVIDDRYGRAATLVATQIPLSDWHERLPDPTLSDAVLDRLVHNAHRLQLQGESMRKLLSPLPVNKD